MFTETGQRHLETGLETALAADFEAMCKECRELPVELYQVYFVYKKAKGHLLAHPFNREIFLPSRQTSG